MKFLVTGDFQLHKGPRFEDACKALDYIARDVKDDYNIEKLYILGDIYERNDIIAGSEEEVVFVKFLDKIRKTNIEVYILVGNHDIIDHKKNVLNSLAVLLHFSFVCIIHEPYVSTGNGIFIPYLHRSLLVDSGKSYREYFNDAVRAFMSVNKDEILFTHCDVVGATPERGSLPRMDAPTAEDIDALGVKACFSGHIHKHQAFTGKKCKTEIVYCGSPIHTTFSSGNDPKGFVVCSMDSGKLDWEFVEIPSRLQIELTYQDGKLVDNLSDLFDYHGTMVKLHVVYNKGEYDAAAVSNIKEKLYSMGVHHVTIAQHQKSVAQLSNIDVSENTDPDILRRYLTDINKLPAGEVETLMYSANKYLGVEA